MCTIRAHHTPYTRFICFFFSFKFNLFCESVQWMFILCFVFFIFVRFCVLWLLFFSRLLFPNSFHSIVLFVCCCYCCEISSLSYSFPYSTNYLLLAAIVHVHVWTKHGSSRKQIKSTANDSVISKPHTQTKPKQKNQQRNINSVSMKIALFHIKVEQIFMLLHMCYTHTIYINLICAGVKMN